MSFHFTDAERITLLASLYERRRLLSRLLARENRDRAADSIYRDELMRIGFLICRLSGGCDL